MCVSAEKLREQEGNGVVMEREWDESDNKGKTEAWVGYEGGWKWMEILQKERAFILRSWGVQISLGSLASLLTALDLIGCH